MYFPFIFWAVVAGSILASWTHYEKQLIKPLGGRGPTDLLHGIASCWLAFLASKNQLKWCRKHPLLREPNVGHTMLKGFARADQMFGCQGYSNTSVAQYMWFLELGRPDLAPVFLEKVGGDPQQTAWALGPTRVAKTDTCECWRRAPQTTPKSKPAIGEACFTCSCRLGLLGRLFWWWRLRKSKFRSI